MPFAKVGGGVAGLFDGLGDGHFLFPEGHSRPEATHSIRMTAGHNAGAGWRAAGVGGIETIEAKAVGGHGIEVGGLDFFESVIASVAPALVVGHAEDNVRRSGGGSGVGERRGDEGKNGEE